MKKIYVINENGETITARDSMNNAIAACMNRMVICGYMVIDFSYNDYITTVTYRDDENHETRTVFIEEVNYIEGV